MNAFAEVWIVVVVAADVLLFGELHNIWIGLGLNGLRNKWHVGKMIYQGFEKSEPGGSVSFQSSDTTSFFFLHILL
jgi:hypothetical protein